MNQLAALQPAPFVRQLRKSQRLDGLVLSEIDYPPRVRIGWHRHELAALALTVRGTSSETFAKVGIERMEAGVLVRPAGERHWDCFGERGARCFLIEVGGEWSKSIPRLPSILGTPSFHEHGAIRPLVSRVYHEWMLNDTASPIAIQALVLEIAAHLIREDEGRAGNRHPVWLKRVKQRLDEDVARTPTLSELAAVGGVHPTHLARQFRRYYHATIGEYIRARRVDAAIRLLTQRKLTITEVALETGFSSHGHLCTGLKQATGMTPSEFRGMKS